MDSTAFSSLFAAAVVLSFMLKVWLVMRQMRHVATHRHAVPTAFRDKISLESHQKAADYTIAQGRVDVVSSALGTAVLLGWTLLGGLDALNVAVRDTIVPLWGDFAYQLALLGIVTLLGEVIELPLNAWSAFRVEQRFGFNRMSWRMYALDAAKGLVVGAVLLLPLGALVLWIMGATGTWWWLWAWGALTAFQLVMMVVYPTLIAPWFNKFTPLDNDALAARVSTLMARCGFRAKGLFVMDGSRRSAHSNAYFTGLGTAKRVVFFDTLLARLSPGELEAVLAHELGHFKLRHVTKTMVAMFAGTLVALALLGWLAQQQWFYTGLGVNPNLGAANDALALLLLTFVLPPFAALLAPVSAAFSRKHEFEADAYACQHADGQHLAQALVKLYNDNARTLTPDPLYARCYYSHPAATERLAALKMEPAA